MDKAAGVGRWLSRRKWMIFVFPTFLIFPFMQYSCNCLIPGGHIKTWMTGYLLCFLLEPFLAYVGVSKKIFSFDISLMWELIFCSINSLISTSSHLNVKFVPPLPLLLRHSLCHFIPTEWPGPSWLNPGYGNDVSALQNSTFQVQSALPLSFHTYPLSSETQTKIKESLVLT